MNYKQVRSKFDILITKVSSFVEVLAAIIIVIVAAGMLIRICLGLITDGGLTKITTDEFNSLLSDLLVVSVGIEFVKLLIRHRLEDVIDVMMLAIARQMVVEHLSMLSMLIAVAAIGVLFAIRRFLFTCSGLPVINKKKSKSLGKNKRNNRNKDKA
mgnify:FL=1